MVLTALIIFILFFAQSNASSCPQSKYCTPRGWCENFTSLVELNSSLFDKSSCPEYFQPAEDNGNLTINIHIKANSYTGPINDCFDWQRFIQTILPKQSLILSFYGFNGVDFNSTFTNFSHSTSGNLLDFHFTFAKFDFYLNGKPWEMSSDGGSTCDETELIKIIDKYKYGIFGELDYLSINFEFLSHNSNFKKWCLLIFKNANIDELHFKGKPIRFFTGNSTYNISGIQYVNFENLVVDNLDKEILHPQVYSLLNDLSITGAVKKIETDVFKEMNNLTTINFEIYDLKGFIHGNGIEWMNYLNYYTPRVNISRFELTCDLECIRLFNSSALWISLEQLYFTITNKTAKGLYLTNIIPYLFPDKDFCIFSNYPHDKSVFINTLNNDFLNKTLKNNCTCSMIWMSKNAMFLASLATQNALFNVSYIPNPCTPLIYDSVKFKHAFNACNFPDKYKNCQLNMPSQV
jgi:hypothetical protein